MAQRDPTDLKTADRAARELERKRRNARMTELDDIKRLMETRWGRRLMWRMFSITGLYRSSLSTNAIQMAANEGGRQVGLMLLADVHLASPEAHTLMTKENSIGSEPADERPTDQ